ncbi:MAG: hypothetical protein L3J57_01660 [Desulfuromusa sp.]|nr:hypothetical protein [Desulfuromusa sp.]
MQFTAHLKATGPLFAKGPELVQHNLDAFVEEVVQMLEREIKELTPQGVYGLRGAGLLNSIGHTITGRGSKHVRGVIGTPQPYGEFVERGRRPGKMPPQGVLLRWVEVKLGLSGKEAQRVEYLIRRKIGQKGTAGAAMFAKGLLENLPRIEQISRRYELKTTVDLNGQ